MIVSNIFIVLVVVEANGMCCIERTALKVAAESSRIEPKVWPRFHPNKRIRKTKFAYLF